eukprot:ANDGO_06892.mRNA.1 Talin-B
MSKVVLKVHFLDDSFKTVLVDPDTCTSSSLRTLIAEKLELRSPHDDFSIYVQRLTAQGGERPLDDDELPCKNIVLDMKGVEADVPSYTSVKAQWEEVRRLWEVHFRYVFKRRLFLKDEVLTASAADEPLVRLVYIQAVSDVISGVYPCSADESLVLAALQMQVAFGDHDDAKHPVGFLAAKITRFLPQGTLSQGRSVQELEADVYAEHVPLRGLSNADAMLQYLSHVRKWYFYGSSFWLVRVGAENPLNLPSAVVLAVNCDGLHLMKTETKELISTFPYTVIHSWAYKVNGFYFKKSNMKIPFETEFGSQIAKTLKSFVDLILSQQKKRDQQKAAENTATVNNSENS